VAENTWTASRAACQFRVHVPDIRVQRRLTAEQLAAALQVLARLRQIAHDELDSAEIHQQLGIGFRVLGAVLFGDRHRFGQQTLGAG
jgi:hypothetical protein